MQKKSNEIELEISPKKGKTNIGIFLKSKKIKKDKEIVFEGMKEKTLWKKQVLLSVLLFLFVIFSNQKNKLKIKEMIFFFIKKFKKNKKRYKTIPSIIEGEFGIYNKSYGFPYRSTFSAIAKKN